MQTLGVDPLTESRGSAERSTSEISYHVVSSGGSILRWLLPLAFVHGLLYLAIVPPWQHYDEPPHFLYARLIALLGRQPTLADFDLQTSREIADSMHRFRFWSEGVFPDLLSAQPPDIGLDQRADPPLYYAVVALPIRGLQYLSIETQLYAARLLGVLLYTLVVMCAWRLSVILAPQQPVLHLAMPLLVLTVPAFSDMMSAVNNDVLVNFAIAAMLLGCVWLIRDGLRPVPLLLAILGLGVALFTKRTAVIAIIPFLLALIWSLHRRALRWQVWAPVGMVILILVGLASFRIEARGPEPSSGVWLSARPWLADLSLRYLRLDINRTLHSLENWERSRRVYPALLEVSFKTFWHRFGWGHVLMAWWLEWAALVAFTAGWAGLAVYGLRSRTLMPLWQKRCIWLFLTTILAAWVAVLLRVHPLPPPGSSVYIPQGRYMHLALLPNVWLLA
ncbi:MAG: glycosyltransferase family 39 protein, partial [Chloroflexales bacterium]|nr:glycosyltransferase family 39 protein [Chloroflexales bacterium]